MSILRLNGSSGYTEITAPTSAGNNRLTLPTSNGSNGNILGTDGAGNLSWVSGRMLLETSKSATGTSVEFTGIPSWVKRITVLFAMSTNGSSPYMIQIGTSGGYAISGYLGAAGSSDGGGAGLNFTTGFGLSSNAAAARVLHGQSIIAGAGSNGWVHSTSGGWSGATIATSGGGSVTLSGTLDRLRVLTVNGTDTFDAGYINILYEG